MCSSTRGAKGFGASLPYLPLEHMVRVAGIEPAVSLRTPDPQPGAFPIGYTLLLPPRFREGGGALFVGPVGVGPTFYWLRARCLTVRLRPESILELVVARLPSLCLDLLKSVNSFSSLHREQVFMIRPVR